jgi:hypothetical protein
VKQRRLPSDNDLRRLAELLLLHQVEYVVIGGGAMALHGFPRGTKDIDLFLPVDHENNQRLLAALRALPECSEAAAGIKLEWLDQGFSTAAEGELVVDLLFVAAGKTFDQLRSHIRSVQLDGVPVTTLDVDGMLLTKQTNRDSDIADRSKLQRLINARKGCPP